MRIDVLSLFPEYFKGPLDESMLKRAQVGGLIDISLVDIRAYSKEKHKRVDDRPYGGGPGMVMMAEPVVACVRDRKTANSKVIYLSPQGKALTHIKCRELASSEHLILLAGHYEGIDERAIASVVDEEISIGDFVLTNGCLAACVVIDAVARFIPGVVGDVRGPVEDSFESGLLDWPHYTKPLEFEGHKVPDVLLSGHHAEIAEWRLEEAKKRTRQKRFDLYLNWLEKAGDIEVERPQLHLESVTVSCRNSDEACCFYKKVFREGCRVVDGQVHILAEDAKHVIIADVSAVHISCDVASFVDLKKRVKQLTRFVSDEMTEQVQKFSFRDPDNNLFVISLKS